MSGFGGVGGFQRGRLRGLRAGGKAGCSGGRLRDPPAPALLELREPNFGLWFQRVVRDFGDREAIRRRTSKEPAPVTYRELFEAVRRAAAGFAALGVKPGDRVGLISDNRREWLVTDLALSGLGAVDVPRGGDSSNLEIVTILEHSGSRGAVVENVERARALSEAIAQMPRLEFLVLLEGDPRRLVALKHPRVLSFEELLDLGATRLERGTDDLETRSPAVESADLLTLVYTSGTTGAPKGVQLTHGNVLANVAAVREILPVRPGDVALSILPTWHMFERVIEYVVLDRGGCLVYTDARRLRGDLKTERPRLMGTVPRIWEGLHGAIQARVEEAPKLRRALFRLATSLALAQLRARAQGHELREALLAIPAALARAVVFAPLQRAAGLDNLAVAVSGGGSLPFALDEFFLAIGIPILNGYGLTETSPVISVRRVAANRPGPVGPPVPETEIRLVDLEGRPTAPGQGGVLQVRGPQVTPGYYHDPEQTRRAFPEPGWFDTGDLARVDERGEIWIVGRAKDTIALRGGEKVEPERIETALKASPLIEQAIVVGQDAKNLGALIVPQFDRLAEASSSKLQESRDEFVDDERSRMAIRAEIDKLISAATGFRPYERPIRFRLLRRPIDAGSGLMTATMKLKRRAIAERYEKEIAALLKD